MGGAFRSLCVIMALSFPAMALLPIPVGSWGTGPSLWRETRDTWNPTYKIGDEWGKKVVTQEQLDHESAAFKRAALATAQLGGGTTFYLGKYNGHFVMATNHHVLPSTSCSGRTAVFPFLGLRLKCEKVFGSWPNIDLALYTVKIEKPEDERQLESVKGNFAFRQELRRGEPLITIGFGVADNPGRKLVANKDSDCKVFSNTAEYRLMADPDELNPGPYKAWSFSNGCDVSHGDSGSAMVDRDTGYVVGIIWTGRIPKNTKVQSSAYLDQLIVNQTEEVWTELSYSVPAPKMGEFLKIEIEKPGMDADTRETLKSVLAD